MYMYLQQFISPLMFTYYLTAQVKMPSGKVDLPLIEDNFDGTVRIQYNPKEDGIHELILLHDGAPVQGLLFLASRNLCKYFAGRSHFIVV